MGIDTLLLTSLTIKTIAMKRVIQSGLLTGLLSFFLYTPSAHAQESSTEPALKEGKVWSVEYIRTKPGKSEEYKKYLAKNYMKLMNTAKKDGLISEFILLLPAIRMTGT